ncbi:MAG: hypothetical protein H0W67_07985 [Gemmatimonadales bacterium]|nr:hypothetical protein [Gemmatimonadales bacterium]
MRPGPLLYVAGDPVAADLAGRLAALSADSGSLRAGGLSLEALADSLAGESRGAGSASGYIVAFDRTNGGCAGLDRPKGFEIIPLIETRSRAVLRRGRATIRVGAGGPLIVFPTRSQAAVPIAR